MYETPPDRWDPGGRVDRRLFACGIQVGDPLPTSAVVSVRQFGAAQLDIAVARWVGRWVEVARFDGLAADRGVVRVEVDGLEPHGLYNVVAFVSGDTKRSPVGRFRTPPRSGGDRVRLAATCCFGHTGQPFVNASRVSAEEVDLVLLLGDTIYGLPPDWEPYWTKALASDGLHDLLLSAAVSPTWDDHEVENNWTPELLPAGDIARALASYRRALPQRIGADGVVWRKVEWGDLLDVFLLDCRAERGTARMLSEAQEEWLLDGVASSTKRWKLVASGLPFTDLTGLWPAAGWVAWNEFPAQRRRILDVFRGRDDLIRLAGDLHFGGYSWIGKPGDPDDGEHEIICGPAGSQVAEFDPAVDVENDPQYDPIVLQRNTVVFEVTWDRVSVRWEGNEGTIAERAIARDVTSG